MKKIKKKPILLFVIAIVVLYIIIYVFPRVSGALISNYIVEYGELRIADEVTGYIVRNEDVYLASSGGKTNYYIKEGTMVRKGTNVMETTEGSDDEVASKYSKIIQRLGDTVIIPDEFKTKSSGVISYYADGYESKVTPDTMTKRSYDYFTKLDGVDVEELDRKSVAKGEPVFKVVDRTLWYMVCFLDKKSKDRYEKGDKVNVEFEDATLNATVYSVNNDKATGKRRVILATNNWYDKFPQVRSIKLTIVDSNASGLLIYNSSIGEKKGQKGVYVKNKAGSYEFVPISVISSDGEMSVIEMTTFVNSKGEIENTVETYDDILKHAK